MKQTLLKSVLLQTLFILSIHLHAQDWKLDKRVNILFGLSQPLFVDGFNIEGNYIHNRFIFDYSHGISLDFKEDALTDDLKNQGVVVHMPYTTGFGVGYRFKEWINLRVEPKWHRFEYYYNGEVQTAENEITAYNAFSLGLGLYGSICLFKNSTSFLKGVMIAPSIRYWPTIHSTLGSEGFSYLNKNTNSIEKITTANPGFGFTPWVFNISIGYTFGLKKNS